MPAVRYGIAEKCKLHLETNLPKSFLFGLTAVLVGLGQKARPPMLHTTISSKSHKCRILNPTSARFSPVDILLLLQAAAPVLSVRNEREFVMELRNPRVHLGIMFGR